MASVPKPPAKKTSPVVWVAVAGAAAAAFLVLGPSDSPASGVTTGAKARKRTTKDGGLFTEADRTAKFAVYTQPAVDAFKPAILKPAPPVKLPPVDPTQRNGVPLNLTGGEASWFITGWDSLNGSREALIENTATGQTVYVKPGDRWKAARVQSIDVSAVTMVGPDGKAIDVPIQEYGEVPGVAKTPIASNSPLGVPGAAINGAIGGTTVTPRGIGVRPVGGPSSITLSNGQTLQLPPGEAAAAVPATQDDSLGVGRRRRRNRNNGDSNNGF